MLVEIEEKELAAIEYLYHWALRQNHLVLDPTPPLEVVVACDRVGIWLIRSSYRRFAHEEETISQRVRG